MNDKTPSYSNNVKNEQQTKTIPAVGCSDVLAPRDQLTEIAMLMDKHFIHEHTENSLTIESVQALIQGMRDAWVIFDNIENERADEWKNKWADIIS